ncbi:LAGLIDADG family homing endonuclease [Hyphomicrobium sp.]|uniref:LAGLIDADG family homing endonuclease n=1 Tax=Hyphomicrobium sp. TaxID=82 RepID=UPI001D8334AA|nr:LAGLIDADG family homing endonuclease [Hyphomicrobium sp.]MBY0562450.1 LAGLIDADG family homing endonuclease [Hyphomicrobium sp.]
MEKITVGTYLRQYPFYGWLPEWQRAYTAGVIDADGSITIVREASERYRTPQFYARVSIVMTTREPIASICEWFGFSFRQEKRTGHWRFAVSGPRAIALIAAIEPFLLLKQPHAAIAKEVNLLLPREYGGRIKEKALVARLEQLTTQIRELNARGSEAPSSALIGPQNQNGRRRYHGCSPYYGYLTAAQKAYLAGYIDSEGCITAHTYKHQNGRTPNRIVVLSFTAVTVEPLRTIARWLDVPFFVAGKVYGNSRRHVRLLVKGPRAAGILAAVRGSLLLKAKQADLLIEFNQITPRQGCRVRPQYIVDRQGAICSELHALNSPD